MKELITMVVNERASLLRGFTAIFMLVLPLTFVPTLIRHGFSSYILQQHIPESMLYATLIATAVIVIALLNNYEKLLLKKRLYSFPAFAALEFEGGVEAYNSIIKELSTYLIGKIGNYYYKLDIIHPERQRFQVEVAPMIRIHQNSTLLDRLINELHFKENFYLSRVLAFSEEQLLEEDILKKELLKLSDELSSLGVAPLEINTDQL